MRQKRYWLVVSFDRKFDALTLENLAPASLGRMIPLPQQLAAGCGLGFRAEISQKDVLLEFLAENDIAYKCISIVNMY